MKDRALARLVPVAALAFVALTWLAGDAHAVAYPCSAAGLHQGLTAGGVITLSCAQPTTIALTQGGNYLQPIDFDGEGRVTITNAGLFGIVTQAQATFKRTTFAGAAPGGRGVIINAAAPITFDRVIIRDITPGTTGGTLFITTCGTACTSRVIDSTITNLIDGVFEVSGSATLEVTNTTFDGVTTPFWTLDAGQVRARYVTIARGSYVGRHFNNGNIRFTSSIIDTSSWLLGNGTATSGGYNVIQGGAPAAFATATDVVVTAPLTLGLQTLAANGGPTPTVALGSCSAAINTVTDNSAPSTDQRGTGFPRVNQGKPDAGAFESNHTAIPCIAEQPTDRTIFATQTLTLSVAASGPANRTYQWKKGANNIPGATSATYTKNNAVVGDAGTYSVVVTGPGGSTTSNNATVVVHGPPAFTTHPQNRNLAAGATLTLTAAASGESVTYQWKKGANNIGGATNATYTKANAVVADSGNYTVVATNPAGSVTSNVATVTVTNPPNITTQPQARTIFATQTLTLSVVASDATSYQWKKGASDIPGATSATYTKNNAVVGDAGTYSVVVTGPGGSTTSNNATVVVHGPPAFTTHPQNRDLAAGATLTLTAAASGQSVTYQWKKGANDLSGATNATYTKANAVVADSGNYTVVATNPAGSVTSNVATVTVTNAPNITTQPQARTIFATQTLTLSVVASDATSYQWKKGANDIPGATSATYTKNNAVVGDAGTYSVVVTGPGGSTTSNNATVVVHGPPSISAEPQDLRAFLGQAVTVAVTAQGEGLGYQWHFGTGPIAGATSASYEFVANEANAGAYSVVVSNPAGSATSRSATVTIDGRPVITVDPEDVTLFAGQTLSLDIQAEGVGLSYQWQLEGADIEGATGATYTKVADVEDTGSYVALVRNGAGEVASTPAAVVVHGPPVIVTPPSAASVFGSTELTLSVVASGESLSYQWRKDEIEIEDATEATYRVTATSELAGQYDVVVTNPAGSVTADAVAVVVYGPPLIVTPPSGLTAKAGDSVSLTVVATGEALTYKWYRDELEVPDATLSTLTFTASEANAGDYIVAVSNPAGTVESEPVTVALEDEPEPEVEAEPSPEPGPELDLEPSPEAAEVETVTKGRSEDGCAGGTTGVVGWLFGLALVLLRRRR